MSNSKFEYVKAFENHNDCLKNTYIVVRIDGKAFTKFTDAHQFTKPNDIQGIKLMLMAGLSVMEAFTEIFMGYGQSDEFSFVFKKSAKLYNRRNDKILTNVLSMFTSSYVFYWNKIFFDKTLKYPPCFDGRIVLYPSFDNMKDYFSWRMVDCHINNLYNTTFWKLVVDGKLTKEQAHNKLKGTFSKDKNEILFKDYGVNYNNEPEVYKKGTLLIRMKNIEHKSKFKCDELLTKDDITVTEAINASNAKSIAVCHCDVIKNEFWDNNVIDFD
jgi:tRNA(His) guanylyltransferase